MTLDQVKNEFAILQIMAKKLVSLTEDQRNRVLNSMLKMVCGDEVNYQDELKALTFCVSKIEKMDKAQAAANVKFLVDRFYAPRCELQCSDCGDEEHVEDAAEEENGKWELDSPTDE